jgi:hypothetical protein
MNNPVVIAYIVLMGLFTALGAAVLNLNLGY